MSDLDTRFFIRFQGPNESPLYMDIEKHYKLVDGGDVSVTRYAKCTGLEDKGKPKNIYTETYADSDSVRVYIPTSVAREETTVSLTLFFIGKHRRALFNSFYRDVYCRKIDYYDTVRLKKATLILKNPVKPEDMYKGNTPYICAEFKFTNLNGECYSITHDENNIVKYN